MIKESRILNRIIRWGSVGIGYEADTRHVEAGVEAMGVQGLRPVITPGVCESRKQEDMEDIELSIKEATLFRSGVARINFMAQDKTDIQFPSKCVSAGMANPLNKHWHALHRLSRYIKDHPKLMQHFPWTSEDVRFQACGD